MNFLRRPQRLLILAFALSLLLHLIFALVVRMSHGSTQNEVESVTIEHREAIMRLQTPPPRPKVTPVPHPRPKVRPAPVATHGAQPAKTGTGGVAAAPSTAPTPQPTPVAVASAAPCAKTNADAAVIGSSVGGYRLEGPGVLLCSGIEGDHFTILGLPLLPLFAFLRSENLLSV